MSQPTTTTSTTSLRLLLDTLGGLSAQPPASPPHSPLGTQPSSDGPAFLVTARLRAALAAFLLAPTPISRAELRALWTILLERLCGFHRLYSLPETALIIENLPGLILHRLDVGLPKEPDQAFQTMEDIKSLVLMLTDAITTKNFEEAGLRTTAPLGPVPIRQHAVAWVEQWLAVSKNCLAINPRTSAATATEAPLKMAPMPLGQPGANLIAPKYSLLFPSPFVQEGLRFLARASNWVTLFSTHLQCIDDASLTPFTRALFTLSLVDEYLTTADQGVVVPPQLLSRFQTTVREIDPQILIPPIEAGKMSRSREEVRVSSALSTLTPCATSAPPGTLMTRVRTDVAVFSASASFLSASALAIFQPAITNLLQHGEALDSEAQARFLALLQQTWTLIQNTHTPSAAIQTLISAGFTPSHCNHYLSALEGFLVSGGAPGPSTLSEIQQLFGCIALTGSQIFTLAQDYGPYADYVRAFKRLQSTSEYQHVKLCEAVGLSGGGLKHILARIMGPITPTEHLASLRRALVGEFEVAERRFSAGQPSLLRETVLIWLDVYGQTKWDITPTTPAVPAALLSANQATHSPAVHVAAATQIHFPKHDGIYPNVLADPQFTPYVMALVVGDALRATCRAAYLPRPIDFACRVLAWARDFGLGYVPTVEGHRTKLGALITLLEPATHPKHIPTLQMADNIEQLLRDLHAIVKGAVSQISHVVRLPPLEPPEVGTSILLMSLYALAARGVLMGLIERADPLIQQLEDAIVLLRLHMTTLTAFFECRFESDGRRVYAIPGDTAEKLGPWRPDSMADAVSQYCGMYHDAKRALVTALAGLKSVIVEATAHLGVCEGLVVQVHHEHSVLSNVLQEIQSFVLLVTGIHARASKLLAGDQVPGFFYMGHFLSRWKHLSTSYQAVQTTTGPELVADFVRELHETWRGLQNERLVASPALTSTTEQRTSAVGEILANVEEDAGTIPTLVKFALISKRCDLTAWGDYNAGPLDRPTMYPESIDLTPQGLSVLLGMDWLMMNELLQVTDGVFRASALRRPSQDTPQDVEVREAGSARSPPVRTFPHLTRSSSATPPNLPEEDDDEMLL
ncbi:tegument protein UL37 [Pteropodid alphaherpesvirus 1]|uniref:Tegument protein UL37 n=1 Tax=Pteropodid alphaherpesvirus 1 TaxID=1343901 RepID=A0A060Q5A0_9ALPH|nr:tegument protein UL37 [Pteropodid alphaherpesvirus 1]BAP00716.1 tegument protein UL37 [Pteropodid alphaherpesvirus 1]